MRFAGPTYGAGELEGLGGRGEAGAVDGVGVLAVVPLRQERLLVHGDPRGPQRALHCALHAGVVDAGDHGGERGLHQVDAGALHAKA